jgi:hypothetical protein
VSFIVAIEVDPYATVDGNFVKTYGDVGTISVVIVFLENYLTTTIEACTFEM